MKRMVIALIALIAATAAASPANSQGVKGDKSSACISRNELRLVAGNTEAARWANLAKIGPKLIGSTQNNVEKTLGKGLYDSTNRTLKYSLSTISGRAAGETLTLIKIQFKDGRVVSFEIDSRAPS
ncbi:MAG: hypothetical protein QG574_3234 [Cyanobacteriota bacterium erpe_2018_sw_21hr_WHONDRS-SW48-000092_B_bin.40]|jgi:hypothetical protein|nr:hypothetical protein [Cyanobacteriota bacterium erpe_2018_sw_21hr_WHONDRS-SW48-000092_B_bin.40]